jgi:replicative DNA helicase
LSDLRESGAIEQDADMVCFIHRPEYYKIYTDEQGNDLRGIAQIIIAKHRNGAIADVNLRFIGQYTRFQNLDDDQIPDVIPSRMNGPSPIGSTATPPPPEPGYYPEQSVPF